MSRFAPVLGICLVFALLVVCDPNASALAWVSARLPEARVSAPTRQAASPPCDSPVYCTGPLLHAVQMADIFPDSKTFVDMPMKVPPEDVLEAFANLPPDPTPEQLLDFVNQYFAPAGTDMIQWDPLDWTKEPEFLKGIEDAGLRAFLEDVHGRWKVLGRAFDQSSSCQMCFSSFVLPHPFIVPGGRFREAYYWDTLWIVDGLLISGMHQTVRDMLRNFFYLIDYLGFVPNGGRIYYSSRSQPPLLTRMVATYVNASGDTEFEAEALPYLAREYDWWIAHRTVAVNNHAVNVFRVGTDVPRPESYHEDVELADRVDEGERGELYQELAAGAESGWDYSSRWMGDQTRFETLRTSRIVPVDLNAILYDVEVTLARLFAKWGSPTRSRVYEAAAESRLDAMHALLWNATDRLWRDYDTVTNLHVPGFFPSSFMPLWADSYREADLGEGALAALLERLTLETSTYHHCGLPTSHVDTDQQWDYPNAWAPLQYFVVKALEKLPGGYPVGQKLAQTWLACNFCGWNATGGPQDGAIYEKYDAERRGVPGGGGEYGVQEGFGWTNGVALRFAVDYNAREPLLLCNEV